MDDDPYLTEGPGLDFPDAPSIYNESLMHSMTSQYLVDSLPDNKRPEETKEGKVFITYDCSDEDDNFSQHAEPNNQVSVGIQTSNQHFGKMEKTLEYKRKEQERIESIDWALSGMFNEITTAKSKTTIGGRKISNQKDSKKEDGGNQVDEQQLEYALNLPILSQIECEYNADQLKRKIAGKDLIEDEKLQEFY